MKLSVVIPTHNERETVAATLLALHGTLAGANVPHELLVVADHCTDGTEGMLADLAQRIPTLRVVTSAGPPGYGFAVRAGLDAFSGDAVAIVMADASDDPRDVITYHRKLSEGWDCVFGSRFIRGATVRRYPWFKLVLNRMANQVISMMFGLGYNDVTNAFKAFKRETVDGLRPFLSNYRSRRSSGATRGPWSRPTGTDARPASRSSG
jgi:dolichol-phosphate mannosyltransferase